MSASEQMLMLAIACPSLALKCLQRVTMTVSAVQAQQWSDFKRDECSRRELLQQGLRGRAASNL